RGTPPLNSKEIAMDSHEQGAFGRFYNMLKSKLSRKPSEPSPSTAGKSEEPQPESGDGPANASEMAAPIHSDGAEDKIDDDPVVLSERLRALGKAFEDQNKEQNKFLDGIRTLPNWS
ncbi:hypothetical protein PFISCL1PPCAC_9092, partial [Pristionchus fissidentatus]